MGRFFLLIVLLVLMGCSPELHTNDDDPEWPAYSPVGSYEELVDAARIAYAEGGYDHTRRKIQHTATGEYLNYSTTRTFRNVEGLILLDEDGVPTRTYGGADEYVYNPVLVAQHALNLYGRLLSGEDVLTGFLAAIDRLMLLQDERGAFTYDFQWRYYLLEEPYNPGWVSGMAQGQALSALARAYFLTDDQRYLQAGRLALNFLLTPVSTGGVMDTMADLHPSLHQFVIFEEYLAEPASYTLNGFMYTLLGLYDWAEVAENTEASEYFQRGVVTLRNILPYYDLGGFTAYDLSHITWEREPNVPVKYHSVHLYQLNALYSITEDPRLRHFYQLWASYVGESGVPSAEMSRSWN